MSMVIPDDRYIEEELQALSAFK